MSRPWSRPSRTASRDCSPRNAVAAASARVPIAVSASQESAGMLGAYPRGRMNGRANKKTATMPIADIARLGFTLRVRAPDVLFDKQLDLEVALTCEKAIGVSR